VLVKVKLGGGHALISSKQKRLMSKISTYEIDNKGKKDPARPVTAGNRPLGFSISPFRNRSFHRGVASNNERIPTIMQQPPAPDGLVLYLDQKSARKSRTRGVCDRRSIWSLRDLGGACGRFCDVGYKGKRKYAADIKWGELLLQLCRLEGNG